MNFIKRADEKMMSGLTGMKYPKRFQSPLSRFLFAVGFNLFIVSLFTVPDYLDGTLNWFNYLLAVFYSTIIFYHWRLWRKTQP